MVMADCPYTKIAVMQLFYELKQKYSVIPDEVVSEYIRQAKYDREECEKRLAEASSRFQLHSYPTDLVKKMTEGKGRPKTLPLPNAETNSINSSPSRRSLANSAAAAKATSIRVEEQRPNDRRSSRPAEAAAPTPNDTAEPTTAGRAARFDAIVDDLDGCECARRVVGGGGEKNSHSAPTTPSTAYEKRVAGDDKTTPIRKHRSTLNVDRTVKSPCAANTATKQPFTKVTLTLRPPSQPPQPSINITTNGPNLLYTTSSGNPQSGYLNQMRISINEEGNTTLSASRLKTTTTTKNDIPTATATTTTTATTARRTTNEEEAADETFPSLLPAFDNALSTALELRLREQDERKNRLKIEYEKDNTKLKQMQEEVTAMEKELERRRMIPFVSEKVVSLRTEVAALQQDCDRMYQELVTRDRRKNLSFVPVSVPENDSDNWTCQMCTFKNHPLLSKCEQCDMAKVDLTNVLSSILRPPTTSAPLPAAHV